MFERPRRQSLSTLQQSQFKIEVRSEIDLANAITAASTRHLEVADNPADDDADVFVETHLSFRTDVTSFQILASRWWPGYLRHVVAAAGAG